MKTALIYTTGRPGPDRSSLDWREAFCQGLKCRGWNARITTSADAGADLLVLWGTRRRDVILRQKAYGGEVCVLERGYLSDRFAWTSVSFGGGLNGHGVFRVPDGVGMARFDRLGVKMTPWASPRPDGYALIMGQVPGDMSIRHVDIGEWYGEVARGLVAAGWSDIRFRPHPGALRFAPGTFPYREVSVPTIAGTLDDALAGAALVVTFNSNSGVDAAIAGRPVIAMDRGSMAWEVAGHALDEIVTPDRTAWAARLAWCQWSKAEIASGECQEAVGL